MFKVGDIVEQKEDIDKIMSGGLIVWNKPYTVTSSFYPDWDACQEFPSLTLKETGKVQWLQKIFKLYTKTTKEESFKFWNEMD